MKTFRLYRTATVTQTKKVQVMDDVTADDDILEASWDTPWQTVKIHDSNGIEIERD